MNIDTKDITAKFVAENLPVVAQALRDEGAKAVNADALVLAAVQAETAKGDAKCASARVEGATEERNRIAKIQGMAVPGSEELVAKAVKNGDKPEDFAVAALALMKTNPVAAASPAAQAAATALKTAETAVGGLAPGSNITGSDQKPDAAALAAADVARLGGSYAKNQTKGIQ